VSYCSSVAWQLTLTHPEKKMEVEGDLGNSKNISAVDSNLCILIFGSLISSEKAVSIHLFWLMNPLSHEVFIFAFLVHLICRK
jgi:hypothetical protein